MSQGKGSRDTLVIFLGLALVAIIGSWSFIRFARDQSSSQNQPDSSARQKTATDLRTISLQTLQDIVLEKQSDKDVRIVDMRPTSLWADEHIIGSENLMLEDAEQNFHPTDAEKSQNWIIVAPSTSAAGQLVALFRARGIPDDRISVFDGTYESWKEKTGLVVHRADPTSALDVTKITLVSPEEAKERIGRGGQWFILDTRSPDLFAGGHIAGATNIPFAEIETRRRIIPSTASILVYGANDRESFAGGVLLFDLGFFNTITLSSGFDEWKTKNLPVGK
ncbi:MAG: rhodanese-like domain-containing protein [Candidatus Moraniibacteriota bacterium]|nr:MAG: rhodanese-like domain-containing protein [Candidatus Moranbacteria bacterium]